MTRNLLFFLFFMSFNCFGQSDFLKNCRSSIIKNEVISFQMKWLKHFFGTNECQVIKNKISRLTSFQEIFPRGLPSSSNLSKWTDDFPYMYPTFEGSKSLFGFSYQNLFNLGRIYEDLTIFKEFKNFKHIYLLQSDLNVCTFLADFPSIKTITTNVSTISLNDYCISKFPIDGVILTSYQNSEWRYRTRVIGIEKYTGNLESLKYFSDLKFLGIARDKDKEQFELSSTTIDDNELTAFNLLNQLTHFSMNVSVLQNTEYLSSLKNLKFLSLNCVDNEDLILPKKCFNPYVKDLNFASELKSIQHLTISNSAVSDISPVLKLKRLKFLKLRDNEISKIPNLDYMSKLEYLDLSGNKIKDVETLTTLKSLKFLNLSGNSIGNIEPLSNISSLTFLNLSANQSSFSASSLSKLKKLKVLNLSGELEYANTEVFSHRSDHFWSLKAFLPDRESRLYWEAMYSNYQSADKISSSFECRSRPLISDIDLKNFKNLEMLSLRNNNIISFPHIELLPKLKILDLERNKISSVPSHLKHPSLLYLDLSFNKLIEVPHLSGFKKIKKLSLSSNDLNSIENLSTLPETFLANEGGNNALDISNNLIQNFSELESNNLQNLDLDLWGNPINEQSCLMNLRNKFLKELCDAKMSFNGNQMSHEAKKCLLRDF
jgi:Leucine-rich repeat (LRR) protein